jgi:hypothetical protein
VFVCGVAQLSLWPRIRLRQKSISVLNFCHIVAMRWFQGGIAEAVAASKARNAIFVVFVEGWFEVLLQLERVTRIAILECHISWNC